MLRSDQKSSYMWNLEPLYENVDAWEKDLNAAIELSKNNWTEIQNCRDKVFVDASGLKTLLDVYFIQERRLEKIYTFAHLLHDEDISNDQNKNNYERAVMLMNKFSTDTSWIEPEILMMEKDKFEGYLDDDILNEYSFHLKKLFEIKDHVLSQDKEKMMTLSLNMQRTASNAFYAFNNVDAKFDDVLDAEGKPHKLTLGLYGGLMESYDRVLRENAFVSMHKGFEKFENTVCELINGVVQNHVFNSRVRGYESPLEASLKHNNIPVDVYKNLISAVKKNIGVHHEYVKMRKELLGVDELRYWDLYVPLVENVEFKFKYQDACKFVVESTGVLGDEYNKLLSEGLTRDGWVDVYENQGKRSGAYSSGCYDSMPYILMNYDGRMKDVLTLAHEAGHSMNTLLSNRKQSYQNSSYPIFVAEVASTFNEHLMYEYLFSRATSDKERSFILNQQIDSIRGTFFRQTMFAEFELKIHELAVNDVPLTPSIMKAEYKKLNEEYFGPDLVVDDLVSIEFLRIPHFYYDFYVYQYATGIAASIGLINSVASGGREQYLGFLASGDSDYPINNLKLAGINMLSSKPVEDLIEFFEVLIKKIV